jgi:uncharacterized membrane protein YsdA (DUF1294 family)
MAPRVRGKIVDWDPVKGQGLVDTGSRRLVLYVNDLIDRLKSPALGDEITFEIGQDHRGGAAVRNARFVNGGGRITAGQLLFLAALLVAPALALFRLATLGTGTTVAAVAIVISLVTFLVYSSDKRRARTGAVRVQESTLHLCALLGGWPGAFLAQQGLRHKTAKIRFQLIFWLIVAAHQYVAVDYLIGWQVRSFLIHFLQSAAT